MKASSTLYHLINRFLVLLFLTAGVKTASAQIPNGGFEEWGATEAGYEEPTDWETNNTETLWKVTKVTGAYEGDYCMKVAQTDDMGYEAFAETIFPMTEIPASLNFYVKTFCANGATHVKISFYNIDFLFDSFTWSSSDTVDTWMPVVLELEQNEPVLTHAVIRVSAEVGDFVPGDAVIWIDDLTFETVTATDDIKLQSISAYPNPCDDVLHLKGATSGMIYTLSDITGREVASGQLTNLTNNIDVSSLTSGVYLLKLGKGASESVRKIIVK